jgi:hypothetical protein
MFETLRNFAEIGIAIAGFSAIASALRSRGAGPWSAGDRVAFLSLLETSALVVFFALTPQVLDQIVENEHALWVGSNLAYAATHAVPCFVQVRRIIPLRAAGEAHHPVHRSAGRALFLGAILLIVTQVALATFGSSEQLRFVYLVLLAWHSCVAGVMFGALILRFLENDAA